MIDRYPERPGAKGPHGSSQDAAVSIAATVSRLRHIARRSQARLGQASPLDDVPIPGVTRERFQPRFSERPAKGPVKPSGARQRNPSAKGAAVLRLTEQGSAAQ